MNQEYKVLTVVYEESPQGAGPFAKLEKFVNQHIAEGWSPLGGIALSSTVGPKNPGGKENWFLRVAQAMTREIKH